MFCGECGTQNPDTNQFCRNCGKPLKKRQAPVAQAVAVPTPPSAVPPAVYIPPAAAPVPEPGAPVKPPMDKGMVVLAVFGIAAGIGSWFRYPYLLAVIAMVLGGIVIAKTKNRRGAIAIVAVLAILIGLACIVVDLFYFTIFPPQPVDL